MEKYDCPNDDDDDVGGGGYVWRCFKKFIFFVKIISYLTNFFVAL